MFESDHILPLNSLKVDAFDAAVSRERGLMRLRDFGSRRGKAGPPALFDFASARHVNCQSAFEESFWRGATI